MVVPKIPRDAGILFKSDAKAENGRAWVGGWFCGSGHTSLTAPWYAAEVTAQNAPWIFLKSGNPNRVIATLELLGTLLCLVLFREQIGQCTKGGSVARGTTDNQGNSLVTAKLMSTKFPLTAVLTEITEVCRQAQSEIHLTWQPREMNQEPPYLESGKLDRSCKAN